MVLLTLTPAAKSAIQDYCKSASSSDDASEDSHRLKRLSSADIGSPIDHRDLAIVSKYLATRNAERTHGSKPQAWGLDMLLRGATVYQPPPPLKPEPTSEYKALMQRLRNQEEERQYERMINPAPRVDTFGQRFPGSISAPGPFGQTTADDIDEISFADVNRQMILIINVLISIICCSVAIWMAARRWSVPQRLGLSFAGSTIVAVAEVAIYMGYINRIKDAKAVEAKHIEKKEIVDTWVIDAKPRGSMTSVLKVTPTSDISRENMRFRKGRNR